MNQNPMSESLKIGITGGIGSGKSTVCAVFEHLGVPVYRADIAAAKIVNTNLQVKNDIVSIFGENIYDAGGKLQRKILGEIVFNNEALLQKLNEIIHPAVFVDFKLWCESHPEAAYVIHEAAILFESGAYKMMDKVINVSAPVQLRIDRVSMRDRISSDQVKIRIDKQFSEEERIKRSDFTIVNDEQHLLLPQILELHKKFTKS